METDNRYDYSYLQKKSMKNFIAKIKSIFSKKGKDSVFKKKKAYRKKDLSRIWKTLILSFLGGIILVTVIETLSFFKISEEEFIFTEEELADFLSDDNYEVLSGIVDRFTKKKQVFESILGKPMSMDGNDIKIDLLSDTNGTPESTQNSTTPSTIFETP